MKFEKWTSHTPNCENSHPNQTKKFKSGLPPYPIHNLVQFFRNSDIYTVPVPAVFFSSFTNLSTKQFIFYLNFFFLRNLSHQIFSLVKSHYYCSSRFTSKDFFDLLFISSFLSSVHLSSSFILTYYLFFYSHIRRFPPLILCHLTSVRFLKRKR